MTIFRLTCLVVALIVTGTAALADWPEPTLPAEPRPASAPIRGTSKWVGAEEEDRATTPLAEFRAKLRQLQEERDALKEDRKKIYRWMEDEDAEGTDLSKLRYRLSGLLAQMASSKASPPRTIAVPTLTIETKKEAEPNSHVESADTSSTAIKSAPRDVSPLFSSRPPDPLALGMALFKAGNYTDALRALKMVSLDSLKSEERMPIKYLMASCLRRQDKLEEAVELYREVANYSGDGGLAACAQWQLSTLKHQQELRFQLQSIRQRRLALEKTHER